MFSMGAGKPGTWRNEEMPHGFDRQGLNRGEDVSFLPIVSMYGIFPYIWYIFMVNVGKYTIHGYYGLCNFSKIKNYDLVQYHGLNSY